MNPLTSVKSCKIKPEIMFNRVALFFIFRYSPCFDAMAYPLVFRRELHVVSVNTFEIGIIVFEAFYCNVVKLVINNFIKQCTWNCLCPPRQILNIATFLVLIFFTKTEVRKTKASSQSNIFASGFMAKKLVTMPYRSLQFAVIKNYSYVSWQHRIKVERWQEMTFKQFNNSKKHFFIKFLFFAVFLLKKNGQNDSIV